MTAPNTNNNNLPAALSNWHSPVSDVDDPAILKLWQDSMEDVHTRFLLNLPEEELATADRILFQIEQAWWFYEDWICDHQPGEGLPRFKHLKPFAVEMFQFSPLLDIRQFPKMWASFGQYKRKISTFGTILLNDDCTKIILCQDWNSKSWMFPAGKINQGEESMEAAARETWEETGFDPNGKYGLTANMKATWQQPLQEKDAVSYTDDGGKHRTFFICHRVPEDFPFAPVARKEVAAVAWHPIDKVPKKNFAVLPLLPKVKRWIKRTFQKTPTRRGRDKSNNKATQQGGNDNRREDSTTTTPLKSNKTPTRKGQKTPNRDRKKQASRSRSRGKSVASEDLVESGLAAEGGEGGWSEEDMFQVNERLLGRKIEYDGNPHVFSEQGFQGKDPHSFHVVGGGFMNSNSQELAPAPPTSRLQHLFTSPQHDEEAEVFTPFFSDDGATPWGEVVQEVKDTSSRPRATQKARKGNNNKQQSEQKQQQARTILATADNDADLVFMTDYEITQKSQQEKLDQFSSSSSQQKYEQDVKDIASWVQNLPKAAPTKHFGEFRFNVDALMETLYQHY